MMFSNKELLIALKQTYAHNFHKFVIDAFQVANPGETFMDNWHVAFLCQELQQSVYDVSNAQRKQHDLIINIPPRSLKSFIVSVALPAWAWLVHPSMKFISSSYSLSLSTDHNMLSRRIIESEWYKRMANIKLTADQNQKMFFENTKRGTRLAVSTGGTVTGRGANVIIIDDPVNPAQALSEVERTRANRYFDETLSTRLNRPGIDIFIVVMQRLHEEDLTGWLLKKQSTWKHIVIPAELTEDVKPTQLRYNYNDGLFFRERFTLKALDRFRDSLGSYAYAGQYLQTPSPRGGGLIKIDWFRYTTLHSLPPDVVWNFTVDPAYTTKQENDPSAMMAYTIHNGVMVIRSVVAKRLEMPALMTYLATFVRENGYTAQSRIFIEPKASGKSLKQMMVEATGLNVLEDKPPMVDKVSRVNAVAPMMESRGVELIRGPWNDKFIHECISFPAAKHDDMVDCLVMGLGKMIYKRVEFTLV